MIMTMRKEHKSEINTILERLKVVLFENYKLMLLQI